MQNQEHMKMKRLTLKSQIDDFESEMGEIRKRLASQQKDCASIQKTITALEIKLEQKRADRHSLLKSCKVNVLVLVVKGFVIEILVSKACILLLCRFFMQFLVFSSVLLTHQLFFLMSVQTIPAVSGEYSSNSYPNLQKILSM
jgi:hypothetical protein